MRTEVARMAAAYWIQKPLVSAKQMNLNKDQADLLPVGPPASLPPPPPPEDGRGLIVDLVA